MNRYNKLKLRTLSVFANAAEAWLKPIEVANYLDFRPHRSMWTYLNRLWRFGLLERRFFGKGTLKYRISETGIARIGWIRSQKR
jgi:hypothetical protein